MKRNTIVVVAAVIGLIAVFALARFAGNREADSYKLAQEMKKQGLQFDSLKTTQASAMYNEVLLRGRGLTVSVSHYGNGLFLKQVLENLEKGKKDGQAKEPIYSAGAFVVVAHEEPAKGTVKNVLVKIFGEVKEY